MTFSNGSTQIVQDSVLNGDRLTYDQWTGKTRLTKIDCNQSAGAFSSTHRHSGDRDTWEALPSQ